MALPPPARINPPLIDQPLNERGAFSQSWTEHMQGVADRLGDLPGQLRAGVVDGSDAAAGDIGEYLTASVAGVALTSGAPAAVATLALPAGDFDVSGAVVFHPAAGTTGSHLFVTIEQAHQELYMAIPAGAAGASLSLGTGMPERFNSAAPQTATLVALAGFVGTMTADGRIVARRAR